MWNFGYQFGWCFPQYSPQQWAASSPSVLLNMAHVNGMDSNSEDRPLDLRSKSQQSKTSPRPDRKMQTSPHQNVVEAQRKAIEQYMKYGSIMLPGMANYSDECPLDLRSKSQRHVSKSSSETKSQTHVNRDTQRPMSQYGTHGSNILNTNSSSQPNPASCNSSSPRMQTSPYKDFFEVWKNVRQQGLTYQYHSMIPFSTVSNWDEAPLDLSPECVQRQSKSSAENVVNTAMSQDSLELHKKSAAEPRREDIINGVSSYSECPVDLREKSPPGAVRRSPEPQTSRKQDQLDIGMKTSQKQRGLGPNTEVCPWYLKDSLQHHSSGYSSDTGVPMKAAQTLLDAHWRAVANGNAILNDRTMVYCKVPPLDLSSKSQLCQRSSSQRQKMQAQLDPECLRGQKKARAEQKRPLPAVLSPEQEQVIKKARAEQRKLAEAALSRDLLKAQKEAVAERKRQAQAAQDEELLRADKITKLIEVQTAGGKKLPAKSYQDQCYFQGEKKLMVKQEREVQKVLSQGLRDEVDNKAKMAEEEEVLKWVQLEQGQRCTLKMAEEEEILKWVQLEQGQREDTLRQSTLLHNRSVVTRDQTQGIGGEYQVEEEKKREAAQQTSVGEDKVEAKKKADVTDEDQMKWCQQRHTGWRWHCPEGPERGEPVQSEFPLQVQRTALVKDQLEAVKKEGGQAGEAGWIWHQPDGPQRSGVKGGTRTQTSLSQDQLHTEGREVEAKLQRKRQSELSPDELKVQIKAQQTQGKNEVSPSERKAKAKGRKKLFTLTPVQWQTLSKTKITHKMKQSLVRWHGFRAWKRDWTASRRTWKKDWSAGGRKALVSLNQDQIQAFRWARGKERTKINAFLVSGTEQSTKLRKGEKKMRTGRA